MPQKNRRQQRRPRRNSESTSLLLVMGESTAKPEIVSIHDNRPTHSSSAQIALEYQDSLTETPM